VKTIAAVSLGLLGLFGSANGLAAAAWSQLVPIGNISNEVLNGTNVEGGTGTYLGLLPGVTGAPSSCQIAGQHTQALLDPISLERVKQMTSIATAALLSGKLVQLHFKGTCGGQSSIYPVVDGILINN
jgi:hypothetical protein